MKLAGSSKQAALLSLERSLSCKDIVAGKPTASNGSEGGIPGHRVAVMVWTGPGSENRACLHRVGSGTGEVCHLPREESGYGESRQKILLVIPGLHPYPEYGTKKRVSLEVFSGQPTT